MNIRFFGAALRRQPALVESAGDTGIAGTTALYTEQGPIPAYLLSPGDRVIRRGMGPIAVHSVDETLFTGKIVRIAPDALGRARPDDFMLLPPDQRLHLRQASGAHRDGIFAVRDLLDGDRFSWHEPNAPIRIVRLSFGEQQVIHAGGLELVIG